MAVVYLLDMNKVEPIASFAGRPFGSFVTGNYAETKAEGSGNDVTVFANKAVYPRSVSPTTTCL